MYLVRKQFTLFPRSFFLSDSHSVFVCARTQVHMSVKLSLVVLYLGHDNWISSCFSLAEVGQARNKSISINRCCYHFRPAVGSGNSVWAELYLEQIQSEGDKRTCVTAGKVFLGAPARNVEK